MHIPVDLIMMNASGDFIGASGDGYNISAVIEVVECDGDITTECCGDQICNGAETESG